MKHKMQSARYNPERDTRLLAYSAAAAALLCTGRPGQSQVIYTDIEPDFQADVPGTGYNLDLNNDGITDFIIAATTSYAINFTYYYGAENIYVIDAVVALPQNYNAIAAVTGSFGFVYPYALESGTDVGLYKQFASASFQSLAYNFFALLSSFFYYPIAEAGYWFGGRTNKFIGLRLEDGGETYYGWARLDVGADNKSFTIKDYAYEAIPDSGIVTELYPEAVNTVKKDDAGTLYAFGNAVHIALSPSFPLPADLTLFDMQGKTVFRSQIGDLHQTVQPGNVPAGMYVAHISGRGGRNTFSKTVQLGIK